MDFFSGFKNEIKKIEDWLTKEYSHIHTGRSSPVILDSIAVKSYGSYTQIQNMASIIIEDPKTLRVSPWDKNQIPDIERAILASDLGLSVLVDNDGLRIIFPQLTTQRRRELIKILKGKLEDARISLRQERDKVWEDIQKQERTSELTEDDKFTFKEELQKLVDEANNNLEKLFKKKEHEVAT